MTEIPEKYDLSKAYVRFALRKRGFDIPKMRERAPIKVFDECIDKSGDCWVWIGKLNVDGYGVWEVRRKDIRVHRIMWEKQNGPIPDGLVVMHKCDNRRCCNPAHLAVGTHAENIADKVLKNRQAKGERMATAKLSDAKVLEMRAKYKGTATTYKELAKEYGVSKDAAQKAVRGIYWKHI